MSFLDRYVRRGTGRYLWATALANPSAPTEAEIAASTDITRDVRETSGATTNSEPVVLRRMTSPQEESIPGVIPAQTHDVVFNDRNANASPYRSLFAKAATGWLILSPYGTPSVGDRVTVLPCESGGNSDVWVAGNVPATFVARLHISGQMQEGAVV